MTIDDQSLLLGIDIGTTGTKCAVYDLYGKIHIAGGMQFKRI